MDIASSMRELVRDILSSHEQRADRVSEIVKGAKQVRGDAQKLIEDFRTSRKGIVEQLRKDLSAGRDERKAEVIEVLKGSQQIIKDFRGSRKALGSELRNELSQCMLNTVSEVRELKTDAQDLLNEFQNSREQARAKLREDLSKARADTQSEVRRMKTDFQRCQAEFKADLKKARAAWQGLGKSAEVESPPNEGAAGIAEEQAAGVPEEEVPELEGKLLAAVEEHPDGITLAEVAEILDVATVVLGRASRNLLDKGHIRKEGTNYFPAKGK